MRCPQCGFEALANAAFCSRCGARVMTPRPETKHEYALTRILPSWWHFTRELTIAAAIFAAGLYEITAPQGNRRAGLLLIAAAAAIMSLVHLARRYTSWSLTSDRLIERRGLLSSRRREMELADVRSIEVNRSLMQRIMGLGNVGVASAASADFMIRLLDIPDPERVAEILRQARLKRLA
jgi:membrane protein YdbS with pleckstrin-like domain